MAPQAPPPHQIPSKVTLDTTMVRILHEHVNFP